MANEVLAVHPAIRHEMAHLDRSVEMAEAAFQAISTGAAEAKQCNVMLGAARIHQGAARQKLASRMQAGKLAFQEAKLVEAKPEASASA